jgi:hypothetical protein
MRHKFSHLFQQRNSKPFLLLEIGMLHMRLHAVDAGRDPVCITKLREENLTPGDMPLLLEAIRKILNLDSAVRDLAIVMNSPLIRHQVLGIPHLSAAERKKVLQHEMKHSMESGETPGRISHWSLGKTKEQNAVKEHVLCAELNRSVADDLIAAAQEMKFNLIGFTSHAQMAFHLLKECRGGNKLNIALLEVGDREGNITLFQSNIWNMERHFLVGGISASSDPKILSVADSEKLTLEVSRAIQYFKQKVRNESINHIFLYGAAPQAAAIKALLESSFRIPVALLTQKAKKFVSLTAEQDRDEVLPLYTIAHAAALNAHFEKYICFLPPEWNEGKHAKSRQLALVSAAVIFYALLGGVVYVLNRETAKIAKITVREQSSAQIALLEVNTGQPNQQLQISRRFALATERSDSWLRDKHRIVAELARELAVSTPSQMRITALDVTEKGNAWQVKLQAEIYSSNGSSSQQLFLKFQEQMRQRACLKHLSWGEVRLADSESMQTVDLEDSWATTRNQLTFTVQGVVPYTALPAGPQRGSKETLQ